MPLMRKSTIACIKVDDNATYFSRKKTDELTEFVKIYKAKGLPFVKYENKEFTGGISKFLSDKEKRRVS